MKIKTQKFRAMLTITFAYLLISSSIFAQAPQRMSYQAVIRNAASALVVNTQIGIRFCIYQGYPDTGTLIYQEVQNPTTNENGLISIGFGGGGGFDTITWTQGNYFLQTEVAVEAPLTTYTITGYSQLLSVPFALYAKTAESISGGITETDPVFGVSPAAGILTTDVANWNNKLETEVDGSVTNEIQVLNISNDTIYLSNGGFVKLPAGFNGQYSSLTGAPTNVSSFTNDAAYLTTEVDGSVTNEIELPTDATAGDMAYHNGTGWVKVPAGTTGQLLAVNAAGAPEWQNPSSLKTAGTNAPTMTSSGVVFNGVINPNGLSTMVAFEYGTDLSYGSSATVSGSPFSGTTNTTISTALITGLTAGTTYHVRLVAQNIFGTFYGNDFTFTYLYYGASYAGGIVFSFDSNGEHGFVCAPDDQSTFAEYFQYYLQDNVSHFSGPDLFYSCEGTINGYNDWYAPSLTLLNMMCNNLKANGLGGFANDYYWSTNILNPSNAYRKNFTNGIINTGGREFNTARVRAVRHF